MIENTPVHRFGGFDGFDKCTEETIVAIMKVEFMDGSVKSVATSSRKITNGFLKLLKFFYYSLVSGFKEKELNIS